VGEKANGTGKGKSGPGLLAAAERGKACHGPAS